MWLQAALGSNSPALAATLSNLSVLLSRGAEGEAVAEAEQLLRRGLAIRRRVFGDEHTESAASYSLLGNLLFYQKQVRPYKPPCDWLTPPWD